MTGRFEEQRETLSKYIDNIIANYRKKGFDISRNAEISDVFSRTIYLKGNYLNYKGANDVVTFANEIVNQLEK